MAAATASDSTVLAAGATAADVLSSKLGFKAAPVRISPWRMKCLASATGLLMSIYAGSRLIASDRQVPFGAGIAFPSWLDHQVAKDALYPGEVLNVTFRNPTAGSITVNWEVESV
jgi:hypothetical protein